MENLIALIGAYLVLILLIGVFFIIVQWKIFTKAGQPGWAVLVPFYNIYVYTQIIKRPKWWMVLYFLPIIPILGSIALLVFVILDSLRLAKVFGKEAGFGVGLILLSIVFLPILAFGDARYVGDDSQSSTMLD